MFLCLFLFPVMALAGFSKFHSEADEVVKKDKFWSAVSFKSGGTTVMEFRVVYEFPVHEVFKVLADTNNLKNYHSTYLASKTLTKDLFEKIKDLKPTSGEEAEKIIGDNNISSFYSRKRGNDWTAYGFYNVNFPWPLANRWFIQKIKVDESEAGKGFYRYEYKMHLGNLNKLEGYWELLPVPGNPEWTEFRGKYESDVGIPVPRFAARKIAKMGLKKDVEDNRRVLKAKIKN